MSPFVTMPPAVRAAGLVGVRGPACGGRVRRAGRPRHGGQLRRARGAGITNTGRTTITGDVGTFPTTTRTGFSSVTLTGTDHGGDAVTQGAKDALVTAYDDAFGRTPRFPSRSS